MDEQISEQTQTTDEQTQTANEQRPTRIALPMAYAHVSARCVTQAKEIFGTDDKKDLRKRIDKLLFSGEYNRTKANTMFAVEYEGVTALLKINGSELRLCNLTKRKCGLSDKVDVNITKLFTKYV